MLSGMREDEEGDLIPAAAGSLLPTLLPPGLSTVPHRCPYHKGVPRGGGQSPGCRSTRS